MKTFLHNKMTTSRSKLQDNIQNVPQTSEIRSLLPAKPLNTARLLENTEKVGPLFQKWGEHSNSSDFWKVLGHSSKFGTVPENLGWLVTFLYYWIKIFANFYHASEQL